MHELLEELPEIFERKFQGRMLPLLEEQHRLLRDNAALRQKVQQLLPQVDQQPTAALLPASLDTLDEETELSPQPPEQGTPPPRSRWRSLLPWRRPGD